LKQIYLSKELKLFYLKDFEKLLSDKNEFWKIEESIGGHLIKINISDKIQTLYSKNGQNDSLLGSYLAFCYIEKLEQKIFKI